MARYVALLRGLNVGGHRVKMARLRGLFEELGFDDVTTLIASGNVMFSTASGDLEALCGRIEQHLAHGLGYEVATFIRSPQELESIAAFGDSTADREPSGSTPSPSSLYVFFLPAAADDALRARIADLRSEMDEFAFAGREIFWRIQGKMSESPLFGGGLEKAIRGVPTTMRNMTTVRRLIEKLRTADVDGSE